MILAKNLYLRIGFILLNPILLSISLSTIVNATPLDLLQQKSNNNKDYRVLEWTSDSPSLQLPNQTKLSPIDSIWVDPKSVETSQPHPAVTFTVDTSLKTILSQTPQKLVGQEGQTKTQPLPQSQPKVSQDVPKEAEFTMPPRIASKKKLNPFTTTLILNGTPISHLTKWELATGTDFGEDRSNNLNLNGIVKIDVTVPG
jgi:hypothetical protein